MSLFLHPLLSTLQKPFMQKTPVNYYAIALVKVLHTADPLGKGTLGICTSFLPLCIFLCLCRWQMPYS